MIAIFSPPKHDGGGICHAVIRSPTVVLTGHAKAHPQLLVTCLNLSRQCRCPPFPPARAESCLTPVYLLDSILVLLSSSLTSTRRNGDRRPLPQPSGPRPLTFTTTEYSPRPSPPSCLIVMFFCHQLSRLRRRPPPDRNPSQGLSPTTHVPRCPHTDTCKGVLALALLAWQKSSYPRFITGEDDLLAETEKYHHELSFLWFCMPGHCQECET